MLTKSVTVSSKGQIALPKGILDHLGSKLLRLEVTGDNEVRIVPITNVAGSLSDYTHNHTGSFEEARDKSWDKEVRSKFKFSKEHG